MNGIIFCVCLTSAISVLTNCSEVMLKRTRKDAGEERVTAKIKADDEFGHRDAA